MQKYETLYIVQPNLQEDQVDEIVRSFEAIIPENKGTLLKTEKWGKRKLAYRLGRHWEGYYVLYEYEGDGSTQRELERRMRIHDHVVRHITTKVDPRMAAELERKAERDKRMEGRRDEGAEGWGEGRDRYDRDDEPRHGDRGGFDRGPRGRQEESE